LTLYQANAPTLTPFSKEDKILKSVYECKGYNARQFITEFLNGVGRRTASTGCWWSSEQSTGVRTTADAVRVLMKTSTQFESLLLSQEDKPRSHRTVREISREAGDPLVISFACYSQSSASQVLQEKARSTAVWSTQHARVIFGMHFERR